jgi:PKD repeat protein
MDIYEYCGNTRGVPLCPPKGFYIPNFIDIYEVWVIIMNKNVKEVIGGKHFSIAISLIIVLSGIGFLPGVGDGNEVGMDFEVKDNPISKDSPNSLDLNSKTNNVNIEISKADEPLENEELNTNIPPVADAGPDQRAYLDSSPSMKVEVHFDASGSHDPDGDIVDYSWKFGDGHKGSGEFITHEYSFPEEYQVTLTVTDNDGTTGTDTVIIYIDMLVNGYISTDKDSYDIGEPINITYTGFHGPPTTLTFPYPSDYHFIIKNEADEIVVEAPFFTEGGLCITRRWFGTVNWTWNQEYRAYGGNRTPDDTIPPTGNQVPEGKYYVWFDLHFASDLVGPAEFRIGDPPKEPLEITTDKYTYYQGEPVHITITGYRYGSSTEYGRGYLIKDEPGNWVRDPPQIITTDIRYTSDPIYHTWNQRYDLLCEYDLIGNYRVNYPNNYQQVPLGKYYIYPSPGRCEPAEIEIIERPGLKIEKEKISGPDEVLTHTYNEWELRIVISGASSNNSYESVIVHDVLPAELKLLEYELSQGTLDVIKKGKGKMGATHLTWFVGNLSGDVELIMRITTRQNPAGKQEFTSPGNYSLNDGAWLVAISCSTGEKVEKGPTDPIYVTALENPDYNNKKSP